MQIHVSSSDGTPLYQQLVTQIRFLTASGRLEEGEQLPPVRKLAEQLLINPNTVARAYRELESDPAETARLLAMGADKAREIAAATMDRARTNVGLLID